MKPKCAYRPLVETLESRLQPGSVITTGGYGWSSLADILSISEFGNPKSEARNPKQVPSARSEFGNPKSEARNPKQEPLVILDSFRISDFGFRISAVPGDSVDNLADALAMDDLSKVSLTGRRNSVPLAAVATPPSQQPSLATPVGSVPQSPTGVAALAPAAASATVNASPVVSPSAPLRSASGARGVPVQMIPVDSGTVYPLAGYQPSNDVHAVPLSVPNSTKHRGGSAGNQASVSFLSYLGGSGPDSMNHVAVRNENGANFIYVAGSFTDNAGRTDAYVAKLTDGATSVVWAMTLTTSTPGPDSVSGLAVNGNGVYVAGSFADTAVTAQTDGFLAQLDSDTGLLVASGVLPNASLAAVTTDPTGNVYVAGWAPDPSIANLQDITLLKATGDLSRAIYNVDARYRLKVGSYVNTAVTTGSGLLVDGKGNLFCAGSVSMPGDPINNTAPFYAWLVDSSGIAKIATQVTSPNPVLGPRGMGTAVAFDPNGNLVFTGILNNDGTGLVAPGVPGVLGQDLLLGRVKPTVTYVTRNPSYAFEIEDAGPYLWYVDDRTPDHKRIGDWTATGLVVLPDGSTIVTGAAYDPAAPNNPPLSMPTSGVDVHMTHFVPGDNFTSTADRNSTDPLANGDPENTFGGTGTDLGLAVALDPTNPNNVYVVGVTNSSDLPTSPGVLQPTYGGGTTTGFVGQVSVA